MLTLAPIEKPRKATEFPPLAPVRQQNIRVTITEPTEPESRGSMGCWYVQEAAKWAGFHVEYEPYENRTPADVELVSLHHCTDYPTLAKLPRVAPIRIIGGHVTTNNIRPAIPFGDVFCIGEGETWIAHALSILNQGGKAQDLAHLPGTMLPPFNGTVPKGNTEPTVPKHPPYLNRAGEGHAPVWYLEMSRGCPFHCSYCELGWAWKYRMQDTQWLLEQIDGIDRSRSHKVSLFAPDEASHPGYHEILDRIHARKLVTSFGSMRLDVIMRKNLPFKPNMLIRVALDGITEATRERVGRKISNQSVYDYFRYMSDRGHCNFKIFQIIGYPWEKPEDWDEWEWLWSRIASIPRKKNAHVRIKFTPLIPQPSTPLGECEPNYDEAMVGRIKAWFDRVRRPLHRPGWFVENDGIMSRRSHALQVKLTRGDERTLLDGEDWSEIETHKGYDVAL